MLSKSDIEAQLRVLEQNQREQEAGLLKMYGAKIALQQLLALIDSRNNPRGTEDDPDRVEGDPAGSPSEV